MNELEGFSVIIATLSVLVMILIGWNIWSAIQIDKRIRTAIKKEKSKFNTAVKLARNDAIGASLAQLGVSQYHIGDNSGAIRSLFNAVIFLSDGDRGSDINKDCWGESLLFLEKISEIECEVTADADTIKQWIDSAKLTNSDKILRFSLNVNLAFKPT